MLEFAVTDDRVSIQEPDGVAVPDFALGLWQVAVDLLAEKVADCLVLGGLRLVVRSDVRVHGVILRRCGIAV